MAINQLYSLKDFTGQDLTGEPAEDFNNSTVRGSCFYQQNAPRSDVFPSGMTGVEFVECCLDNCNIPAGNTLTRSSNVHIKVIDGVDCVVNVQENKIDTFEHYKSVSFWEGI